MPRHRRSNDMRRLLVIHETAKRMQAEAVEQEASTTESAGPDDSAAHARGADEGSRKPGWLARVGLRRKPSPATTFASPKAFTVPPTVVATRASATLKIAQTSAAQTASGWERLRQLLESTRPATWVFTGDTIAQGGGQTGAGRTYSEHFGDHLRNKLRRLLDVVINTGVPNSRCENFLKTLDWRVTRFAPETVFVMLGPTDAAAGAAGRAKFRSLLHEVVDAFEASATMLILQTPPTVRPDRWTDVSDLPAYVDLVREVAAHREVPLIDHCALFENRLSKADSEPDWWSADGVLPNMPAISNSRGSLSQRCRRSKSLTSRAFG